MHKWRTIILLFLPAAVGVAQTQVDLSKQGKAVDFSQAKHTKPAQAGSGVPTLSCSTGEVYFQLDATAGQNLFLCTTANHWTQLTGTGSGSGGGSPTSTSALTDLLVTYDPNNPTVLTIGGNCASTAPCRVRFGGNAVLVNSATLTITTSGLNVGGMVYIYVASDGTLTVNSTVGGSVQCTSTTTCSVISSSPFQFPTDSVPLATWTASGGQWDQLGGLDRRAFISNRSNIAPGAGIVVADTSSGQLTISADTSVVGVRVAAPATSSSTCVKGNYAVDSGFFYQCLDTNAWIRVSVSTTAW